MRHFPRSRRIQLGWLKDVFDDERNQLVYSESKTHKGDLKTKYFDKFKFEQLKQLIGIGASSTLRGDQTWRFVCIAGRLRADQDYTPPLDSGNGSGTERSARGGKAMTELHCEESLKPGEHCWVIETGAGHHLIPKGDRSDFE